MQQVSNEWTTGYMPLIIGGIGAMASALFMPWLTVVSAPVGEITRLGIQTRNGRLFALGLLVLAVLAWSEARSPRAGIRTALLAGLVVLGATLVIEYQDLTRLVADLNAGVSQAALGFGPYATGLGLTASVAGVLKRRIALEPVRHRSETKTG
jgi:hypothetical protein